MPKKVEKRSYTEAFQGQEPQTESQSRTEPEMAADEGGEVRDEGMAEEEEEENVNQSIIILHPGSSTLHLGLSTDPTPHSIPHIIAYRNVPVASGSNDDGIGNRNETENKLEQGLKCVDESMVLKYNVAMTPEFEIQREEGLASIMSYLDDCRVAASMLNYSMDREEYISHNGRIQPVARDSDDLTLTDITAKPNFIIGNDALYLPSDADYTLLKPMHHLTLKDSSLSLSRSNILSMLEDLWTKALEDYLEIPRKEFKFYRVILIVPDIIERSVLKELMNLLLLRMEFAASFLHQESVCAAYCAGLSSACIINVGDEVTNICCVEDGMSNPNTRLMVRYGGSDITRLLHWLLQQTNFPYKECSEESRLSGVLIQHLKESICHMDPTLWGVKDYQFSVMTPTPGILHDYELKLADEAILAPMGVFFPQAFCLPPNVALMRGQELSPADNEDLFDEAHWTGEVGGAGGGAQNKISNADGVGVSGVGGSGELPEVSKRLQGADEGLVFGLDQAVHLSIDCASSLEMKQKLYGGILIVGGGLAFPGAANLLQSRLELKPLTIFPRSGNNIEVFANPRDLESSFVVWKGCAVLSCLDTGQELWIERQEWEFSGVRLLRERAPFSW